MRDLGQVTPCPAWASVARLQGEGPRKTQSLHCLQLWHPISLCLLKAFLSKAGLLNLVSGFRNAACVGKEKTQQLVCRWIRVLCSSSSNKLCLGSRIIAGCLGFCGSGFLRNCSRCRKVGVNLCRGCVSGHALAESSPLAPKVSRCNDLVVFSVQDDTHLTLITQMRLGVRALGFIMDHSSGASERLLDQVETLWSTCHRKWNSQKHQNWLVFLNKVSGTHWNGVQVVSWKSGWSQGK